MTETILVPTSLGRVAVVDAGGPGPALLLLHGLTRSAADWLPVTRRLAPTIRTLAVDFPGHGESDDVDTLDWPMAAKVVDEMLTALGLDEVWIAGHSLGGLVGAVVAASDPRVRGFVNVDGHGVGHESQFDGLDAAEVAAGRQLMRERSVEAFHSVPAELSRAEADEEIAQMSRLLTTLPLTADEVDVIARAPYADAGDGLVRRRPTAAVCSGLYTSLAELDAEAYYRRLSCPTVIIRTRTADEGGEDQAAGEEQIARLIRAFDRSVDRQLAELDRTMPNVQVRHFGCGHAVTLEAPDELTDLLRDLIGLASPATVAG